MSKVLEASCVSGIVKVGALPVPSAEILSEGVGSSSGILVLAEDEAFYLAKTSPDLKSTLDQLSTVLGDLGSALTTIATTLTSIGAGMTGPTTAPPPTLATGVADITAKVTTIAAAKTQIDLLKGMLK